MTRRTAWAVAAVLLAVGVVSCVFAIRNFANRFDMWPKFAWSGRDTFAQAVGVASAAIAMVCGVWLLARMARPSTGLKLIGAGVALAALLAADYWNSPLGPWLQVVAALSLRPLLFTAVLAWPTGRFSPRWARRVRWLTAGYVAVSLITVFVGAGPVGSTAPWGWQHWPIPTVGSAELGFVVDGPVNLILYVGLAVAVLTALVHRRRRVPVAMRSLTNAGLLAGVVAVGGDLWLVMSNTVSNVLETDANGLTLIGTARAAVDYGRFGLVGVLLVVDARSRLRAAAAAPSTRQIELAVGPSVARVADTCRELLGDPTVRLAWAHDDGWVDDDGQAVTVGGPGRSVVPISDPAGVPFAALDRDAALVPAPSVIEAVGAQIQLSLLRSRRVAEAAARRAELRALQRALLDAQDASRRRIERDLHDGAQQQLVGLALRARLDARNDDPVGRRELADALDREAGSLEAAIVAARPAVLGGGLAAALATLSSSAPIPVDLEVDGDLPGDDPIALEAWFVAVDAITNVLKHSGARRGSIRLRVGAEHVELAVGDDGIGGLPSPPRSIADRVERAGGDLAIRSMLGAGTTVRVSLPLHGATVGVGS